MAKPLLNKLNTCLVWDAYKLLRHLGLAKDISRADAMQFRYKPLKEVIGEVWLSALDGALTPHERGSAYYNVVCGALSIPSKILKNNADMKELARAADNIMTGGDINNQYAAI